MKNIACLLTAAAAAKKAHNNKVAVTGNFIMFSYYVHCTY